MGGHHPPRWWRIDWNTIRAAIQRLTAGWTGQPGDTPADASASTLITHLDEALLAYQRHHVQGHDFMHAKRKDDHVEDLRRLATDLLEVLSDWEGCANADN
jgi:hypothetical protein